VQFSILITNASIGLCEMITEKVAYVHKFPPILIICS